MNNWEEVFTSTPIPKWLYDFDHDPLTAVDAALWGRYYFGNLNLGDPSELLIDWAHGIGERNNFIERLDEALAQWIQRTWGRYIDLKGRHSSPGVALAWIRLTEVVASVDSMKRSGHVLRQRFDERTIYLEPLCQGSSRDPLGKYLHAVARHQDDHSLLPIWWNYCDLTTGIPWYHGIYGIFGLRGLPPLVPKDRGRFPEYVAIGLIRLAVGLYGRSLNKALTPKEAKAEFQRVAHLSLTAYPFPERWRKYWREQIALGWIPDEVIKWMTEILPEISSVQPYSGNSKSIHSQFARWKDESLRLTDSLRKNPTGAVLEAERLLNEVRLYTAQTGNSYNLCRSLLQFVKTIITHNPVQAARWAEEARSWEPWNAYCWTLLIRATRLDINTDISSSLNISWEALTRFPDNVVVRTEVAKTLKIAGHFLEAEALYRETIELFPDDVVVRSELAEVLKRVGKLAEAEMIYRENVELFPTDEVVHCELAAVLKQAGRLEEAEVVYREALDRFPNSVVARSGLGQVLIATNKSEVAEAMLRETVELFPDDVVVRSELAEVLKRAGKLAEAEMIYREAIELFPNDVIARVSLAEILVATNKLTEAEAIYREATKNFRNDITAKIRLAKLLRLIGVDLLGEPLELLDAALLIDSTNIDALIEKAHLLEELGIMEEANKLYESTQNYAPASLTSPDSTNVEASEAVGITQLKLSENTVALLNKTNQQTYHSIDRRAVIALSSYSRFLRRWARQNEFYKREPEPSELRKHATDLINKLLQTQPYNVQIRTEMGLLLLESKDFLKAESFLNESISLLPGDAGLRFALARVKREIAALDKHQLDHSRPELVTAEWNQLHLINPDLHPLEHLGKGRAWLAHTDGDIVSTQALRAFKSVRGWMRQHLHLIDNEHTSFPNDPKSVRRLYEQQKGFEEWWCLELQAYLFGPININLELEKGHLDTIINRLKSYTVPIDSLEEDFALHVTLG